MGPRDHTFGRTPSGYNTKTPFSTFWKTTFSGNPGPPGIPEMTPQIPEKIRHRRTLFFQENPKISRNAKKTKKIVKSPDLPIVSDCYRIPCKAKTLLESRKTTHWQSRLAIIPIALNNFKTFDKLLRNTSECRGTSIVIHYEIN